jgi:hypothetical protein
VLEKFGIFGIGLLDLFSLWNLGSRDLIFLCDLRALYGEKARR